MSETDIQAGLVLWLAFLAFMRALAMDLDHRK